MISRSEHISMRQIACIQMFRDRCCNEYFERFLSTFDLDLVGNLDDHHCSLPSVFTFLVVIERSLVLIRVDLDRLGRR